MEKSFKQYLIEKLSSVLYHTTDINGAYHILKDNRFKLSATFKNNREEGGALGKLFFMSFSRNLTNSFTDSFLRSKGSAYTFDVRGDILATMYKGKAFSYFDDRKGKEFEDRLVADHPYIENAEKYINQVHCYISQESSSIPPEVVEINNMLEEMGIKIYYYVNKQAFLIQNKSKAVSFDKVKKEVSDALSDKDYEGDDYKKNSAYSDLLDLFSIYKNNKTKKDLTPSEQYIVIDLLNPSSLHNLAARIKKFLSTYAKSREILNMEHALGALMKRYKAKTIDQFLEITKDRIMSNA